MTQEQVLKSLQAEKDFFLAQECVIALAQNPTGFHTGIVQTKEHFVGLYTIRLRIAKSLKKAFFENDEISTWELALKQLSVSNADEVLFNWISTEDKTYFLFWDSATSQLISIFYLYAENAQDL